MKGTVSQGTVDVFTLTKVIPAGKLHFYTMTSFHIMAQPRPQSNFKKIVKRWRFLPLIAKRCAGDEVDNDMEPVNSNDKVNQFQASIFHYNQF